MTKTQLLDLPNELFLCIFQYLNSTHLIEAFSCVQSKRIQTLLQSFLIHLDISQETDQWIQTYLPKLLEQQQQQQHIVAIRLEDKNMTLISQYLSLSKIQSMDIFNKDWSTDTLKQGLDHCRQYLKRLSITFKDPYRNGDIASHLFQTDCQLEDIHIIGRCLFFNKCEINTCTQLKYLSIELEGMYRVFILMQHLPNLQQLKVKFRMEEHITHLEWYVDNIPSYNTLHRVMFTGCTKYFEHFEAFFNVFGSTISYLTINIDLMYNLIDGTRLERDLLNKMPCLQSLDLIIHSVLTHSHPISINTFESPLWQKFNPMVYWNDIHAYQHTIFTLPYRSNQFKQLSNDFILSCVSNREVTLYFERVRILSLIFTTSLTLDTFEFIKKAFPNIKTLELTNPTKMTRAEYDSKQNHHVSPLNDNFLSNNILQISSITTFHFLLRSHYDNYRIFRRFIHLLPSLVNLQMFIGRALYHQIVLHQHEDIFIRHALDRIEVLQLVPFYDKKNVLNNEEIRVLFPNAQILFNYIF